MPKEKVELTKREKELKAQLDGLAAKRAKLEGEREAIVREKKRVAAEKKRVLAEEEVRAHELEWLQRLDRMSIEELREEFAGELYGDSGCSREYVEKIFLYFEKRVIAGTVRFK